MSEGPQEKSLKVMARVGDVIFPVSITVPDNRSSEKSSLKDARNTDKVSLKDARIDVTEFGKLRRLDESKEEEDVVTQERKTKDIEALEKAIE